MVGDVSIQDKHSSAFSRIKILDAVLFFKHPTACGLEGNITKLDHL